LATERLENTKPHPTLESINTNLHLIAKALAHTQLTTLNGRLERNESYPQSRPDSLNSIPIQIISNANLLGF
jgi:hypothetical protein